ncbi:MAG TPA: hypothetical protein ENN34_06705 [Deltaproteobacteria bacterium]|nr:hypothetical protein [Deltaproteobacteria bacterium]
MNSLKAVLHGGKDRALSASLKIMAQRHLKRFGDVVDLHLDTSRKTLEIEMVLSGEDSPVTVHLGSYVLEKRSGKTWLTISEITASRVWIQRVAQEFLVGRAFEIPPAYAKLVEFLL